MGGEFTYRECADCGSLSLANLPSDAAEYYPANYYEHVESGVSGRLRPLVKAARVMYDRLVPVVSPLTGRWGLGLRGATAADVRVLDSGCGSGRLLERLRDLGLLDLTGIDPWATFDAIGGNGKSGSLRLLNGRTEDLRETFDTIMYNHRLEHVEDPRAELSAAKDRLAARGRIVVRVPLLGYAWRRYGRCWAQFDAPRHFTLFSKRGLLDCAVRAGLRIESTTYDSNAYQFWASEGYVRGRSPKAQARMLTLRGLAQSLGRIPWDVRSWLLNVRHDGDQAAFVLRPS
jgi:SAM-dependent methyltransferase